MDPRIPPILHPMLDDYTCQVDRLLPGLVSALYLTGSVALEGFNLRSGMKRSLYLSRVRRAIDARAFLKVVIRDRNNFLERSRLCI